MTMTHAPRRTPKTARWGGLLLFACVLVTLAALFVALVMLAHKAALAG